MVYTLGSPGGLAGEGTEDVALAPGESAREKRINSIEYGSVEAISNLASPVSRQSEGGYSHMTHCVRSHTNYCWEVVSSSVCASGTDLPPLVAALEGNWLAVVPQRGGTVGVAGWGAEVVRVVR